jgi:hypothetical protein
MDEEIAAFHPRHALHCGLAAVLEAIWRSKITIARQAYAPPRRLGATGDEGQFRSFAGSVYFGVVERRRAMADTKSLLGTWKMVSWTQEIVATGATADVMGPSPIGYIAYHADGRMIALVFRRDRPPLSGAVPTNEEKVKLFDTMLAYTAAYTVEADRIIHHVDAAWTPAWIGDLIRPYKLDGDLLTISGAPSKDPATGQDVVYRIVFQKGQSSD